MDRTRTGADPGEPQVPGGKSGERPVVVRSLDPGPD